MKTLKFLFLILLALGMAAPLYAQTAEDWVKSANEKNDKGDREGAIADCNKALQADPKSAWAFNVRGVVKHEMGRHEDAISDYNQSIALSPKYEYAYNNRGNAKSDLGRYADALADFDKAIALNDKYAQAYNNRGTVKIKLERYSDAILDFNQAIALDASYAKAYNNRGYSYYKLGGTRQNYALAIADFDKAKSAGGTTYVPHYNFRDDAVVQMGKITQNGGKSADDWVKSANEKKDRGDNEGAIDDCNRALQLEPRKDWAFNVRGIAKYNLKRYTEAIADYSSAIAINSGYTAALYNRGIAREDLNQYTDAITDYDAAIAIDAKYLSAYNNRGFCKTALGRFTDAIADFDQAIALDAKFAIGYNNRGYAYYKLGGTKDNFTRAIADYDKAMEVGGSTYHPYYTYRDDAVAAMGKITVTDNNSASDLINRAIAKESKGDNEGAIADCTQALRADPKNTWALNVRGVARQHLKQYDEAIADYDKAIAIDATYAGVYVNRGLVKEDQGRYADAVADYNKVIELDPKNENAWYERGRSKENLGQYKEAIADYDQLLTIDPQYEFAYNGRGLVKNDLGQYADAIIDLNHAIQLDPKDKYAYNNRGYAYFKIGGTRANYQQAIADYDKCVETGGADYRPHYTYRDDAVAAMGKIFDPVNNTVATMTWLKPVADFSELPPDGAYHTNLPSVQVKIKITGSQPVDQSKIKLQVNGYDLLNGNKTRLVDLRQMNNQQTTNQYNYTFSATVDLQNGNNKIQLVYDRSASDALQVIYQPQTLNLYVLSVGTNRSLNYAVKDAVDFAAMFSQPSVKKYFNTVAAETLTGNNASAYNITQKVNELVNKTYQPNDVLLVFISSHGKVINNEYRVMGSDFETIQEERTSVNFRTEIYEPLKSIPCKKFVFLDACYSGSSLVGGAQGGKTVNDIDISREVNRMIASSDSLTIITSSSSTQESWEDAAWQNGAFTKALKEAMQDGRADQDGNGLIDLDELYAYLTRRVPQLVREAGKIDYNTRQPVTQNPGIKNPKGKVCIYVY